MPEHSERYAYIWAGSFIANLFSPMAQRIRSEFGWSSILVTTHPRDLPNAKRFGWCADDFAEIMDLHDVLKARPVSAIPNEKEMASLCEKLERDLGISATDLIRSDRHIGLDFVSSAWFHGSRYGRGQSYFQSLDVAERLCRHFEAQFERCPPAVTLAYPGGLPNNAMVSVGEALGAPMRGLGAPRRKNGFFWMADRFGWPSGFEKSFQSELAKATRDDSEEPPEDFDTRRADPERSVVARRAVRREMTVSALSRAVYRQVRRNLPRELRHRAVRYGDYLTFEKVWYEWLFWRWKRASTRMPDVYPTLSNGPPYVFLPLAMEPEASLYVEAQWADFQLGLIDMAAKALPSGWLLVVKEHPAQSIPRRRSFRDIVGRYPNVRQASAMESAAPLVDGARTIIIINGTVGWQAAMTNKPVISFHQKSQINVLPHVLHVDSYVSLRAAFRRVRDNNLPDNAIRWAAIRSFDRALALYEFPLTDPKMVEGVPSPNPLPPTEFDVLFAQFSAGLERDAASSRPPRDPLEITR